MRIFKPLGPRVLIKRIDDTPLKSALIEVIQHEPSPSQYAMVLSVGKLIQTSDLKEGDVVILGKYCGAPVFVELSEGTSPEECAIVMEEDILGVMEGL